VSGEGRDRSGSPPRAGVIDPVVNSAYGNNAEVSQLMAATITAQSASDASVITISASPLLRRLGTWAAPSEIPNSCRNPRSPAG
jgi:hypothetical protein